MPNCLVGLAASGLPVPARVLSVGWASLNGMMTGEETRPAAVGLAALGDSAADSAVADSSPITGP